MLLNVSHLNKGFGEKIIISDATFAVDDGEKFAIVGNNGCGKSTLLKMIVGEMPFDDGDVSFRKDSTYGYLAQYHSDTADKPILEEVLSARNDLLQLESKLQQMEAQMSTIEKDALEAFLDSYHKLQHEFDLKGGYTFRSEASAILKGLGFDNSDFNKTMNELSGGQKTRVSLGKLLAQKPDVLLLDEPINHLDLKSIMWLEGYLSSYKGAVIIVAHDRYFLDKIADHVVYISHGKTTVYKGNYTDFVAQKEIADITYQRSYEKQQKEIEHQKEVIEKLQSFNREKSIKRAESRKKTLDKMDVLEAPVNDNVNMRLSLEIDKESGKDVLEFNNVSKSYDHKNIFSNLSFDVHKGDRVAILGDNGTGKTTILKVINGLTDFEEGEIKFGANVTVGYYDQEQQGLTESNTIFSELHDAYPYLTETQVRNTLAAFLFTADDVFKSIRELSGGERARVALAKLMLSRSNFLILDEPTNHLDIETKQMLEKAILEYPGTLLYVSHDRYFVNKTCTFILELSNNSLTKYLGSYDDYISKKEELNSAQNTSNSNSTSLLNETTSKIDYQKQKEIEANKRKQANKINKIEAEIEEIEKKIKDIDEAFLLPENMTNSAKLNELTQEQNSLKDNLDSLYEEWELLNS